jgi:tRNA nucleotidyltransferase (CCA-adding enzyme)
MKIAINPVFSEAYQLVSDKLGKENVYLVGGFVRDTLLKRATHDMDFATPLEPSSVFKAFPYGTYFEKYGTVSFKISGIAITIASFRKEKHYLDHRHPSSVTFVKSLYEDYKRRDFTVNALYVNASLDVIDPTRRGLRDLTKSRLCLIGNNRVRLREDPLRIVRAYRFSSELGFTFSRRLSHALQKEKGLVKNLNPQKIREEVNKAPLSARKNLVKELGLEWAFEL